MNVQDVDMLWVWELKNLPVQERVLAQKGFVRESLLRRLEKQYGSRTLFDPMVLENVVRTIYDVERDERVYGPQELGDKLLRNALSDLVGPLRVMES